MRRSLAPPSTVLALLLLSGCSTLQGPEYGVYDRAESPNRFSFEVMETVDRAVGRPAARFYRFTVPGWFRDRIALFFGNLRTVDSALNSYLQGDVAAGNSNAGRVLVNSTLGLGGLFDVATGMGLEHREEDFGQTLAAWGYTRSRYVYFPVIGPTTVRDLPGDVFHRIISPRLLMGSAYNVWVGSLDTLSHRADSLEQVEARDEMALDPYAFTREAFHQKRKFEIFNGAAPADESMFDELDDE